MDPSRPGPRLCGPADPARFVLARGERIALLGRESGELELWAWPVQLARIFGLRLRAGGEELPGPLRVTDVEVRPGGFTLRFVHPEATLELEASAHPTERALVIGLGVSTDRELEVALLVEPTLQAMWPAALGGRIATRDAASGALLLTEERGRFAALIGSDAAAPIEVRGDHSLGTGPVPLRIPVAGARTRAMRVEIVVAAAEVRPPGVVEGARRGADQAAIGLSRTDQAVAEARELYRRTLAAGPALRAAQEARVRALLERELRFTCDDARLEEACGWARLAIERAWVQVDGIGRGLVAGLAPAGHGDRPGYGWFFDGDALIASRALTACGDREGAREVLRFAASHQRADGKLMHELVLSAGLCDWLGDYPYAYYKGENAARFIACLAHHARWSGDLELVRELWGAVERGLAWCEAQLDDSHRMSNLKAGISAVEAGPLADRIAAEIFLHGIFVSAAAGAAWMARVLEREDDALRFAALEVRAREGLETFWSERRGRYAFAHLVDGSRAEELTAYTALPIAAGHGRPERALATARQLNHPLLCADWGARMFAEDSDTYEPGHYNHGSVFPYLTGFVALALHRQALGDAGWQVVRSLVALRNFGGLGLIPEHLRGDRAVEPARGVPLQIFSSSALLQSTLFGLCGLEPDATRGELCFAPTLPADLDRIGLERLAVGESLLDLSLERERRAGRTLLRVCLRRRAGPALRVRLAPRLPVLSQLLDARAGGRTLEAHLETFETGARVLHVEVLEVTGELELELELRLGPQLRLPSPELVRGARSRALRLVDQGAGATAAWFELWGPPASRHRVHLVSDLGLACDPPLAPGGALDLELPGSDEAYARAQVRVELEDPV